MTGEELHVTNGDATVPGLRAGGVVSEVLPWRDVLHEGPVPDVPAAELRMIRGGFLARAGAVAAEDAVGAAAEEDAAAAIAAELERRDAALAAAREGRYVLWFEADLYDQLQIVQILARLRELGVPAGATTLICIGEYPGIARFGGLGELTGEQLRGLPAIAATPLSASALDLAARAWAALRSPDPGGLAPLAAAPSRELRFLGEAFDRLSREYPSARDGLSLSERRILAAVAGGADTAGEAFERASAREARPFLGDTWCFERIARLASASIPLLGADPSTKPVARHTRVRLCAAGRRVLEGREDHVALNGIDRWIGGVHLSGREAAWRFDEGAEALVASPG